MRSRVVLWGACRRDVQAGSDADRAFEALRAVNAGFARALAVRRIREANPDWPGPPKFASGGLVRVGER
jgi:hypothetical protein